MSLGFRNAKLPRPTALARGGAFDKVEADLQSLFIDLFNEYLAAALFDVGVIANPQLGSIELVRRSLDDMGTPPLAALSDTQTRLVHKSWIWVNQQKRGLFLLRALLRIIYKDDHTVEQYWHPKATAGNYPNDVFLPSETPDISAAFLTSRVLITIPIDGQVSLPMLREAALSILPARIVPEIRLSSFEREVLDCGGAASWNPPDTFVPEADAAHNNLFTTTYNAGGA